MDATQPPTDVLDPKKSRSRRWHLSWINLIPAVIALIGATVLLYPSAASWVTQYNQSHVVNDYEQRVQHANPSAAEQLSLAKEYNAELHSGAQLLANANVPKSNGTHTGASLNYNAMLRADTSGLMGRIKIPSIKLDLPIYHGTSEDTLLHGIGHLEGTSLPVGGKGQRTVLTGHRGLAEATMFTNLNQVQVGQTFTIEVFGEVLTYRVRDTKIIDPEDTQTLRAEPGKDLTTLVTCTPLGINSHRILVTGERVTPTPVEDQKSAGQPSTALGFPWWLVLYVLSLMIITFYVWWERRIRPTQTPENTTDHEL